MKLIYILVTVCSVVLIVFWYLYFFSEDVKIESIFDVNIKEKLIFKFDRKDGAYTYDFSEKKFNTFQEDKPITPIQHEWDTTKKTIIKDNVYLYNWELYIDWKKELKCEMRTCPYYLDKSWRYLILIDRKIYKSFFFTKLLAQNVFKIFDLKTLEYMNIQSLQYNWKEVNGFDIVWYME